MNEAYQLLERLHAGPGANYFWRKRDKRSAWYAGTPKAWPSGDDIYWNVHPCSGVPARGEAAKVRGKLEDIARLCCLFAEFDAKDFGDDMQAVLEHIEELSARPSALICSGHGYHAYWLLDEPLDLSMDGNRELAMRYQARWVEFVGGDHGAKDLSRVLRVPGTTNTKGPVPIEVTLEYLTDDTYNLDELIDQMPDSTLAITTEEEIESSSDATFRVIADDLHSTMAKAFQALSMLKPERRDEYEPWLEVGMSLRELGQLGLAYWDEWSQKSEKYVRGECSRKWQSFTEGDRGDLTIGSLIHWAEADSGRRVIPKADKHPKPSDYIKALEAMGYSFSLNTMADDVHINGIRQDDIARAVLFTELAEFGYGSERVAEHAWIAKAAKSPFHPVRDYLNNLTWDGGAHIDQMCSFVDGGANTTFNQFFRRWCIGAVARPMAGPSGVQSRAFVWDGRQGIGKSRLVRFLGSPLPQFFMESGINTDDKDFLLYLCSTWIWEVAELGSTLRKADREALKHFLSRQTVTVRRAYGRVDMRKPAIAAFIPTINNEAGFLWDPSGYRRFMVATIKNLNWDYEQAVDVNQLWAEATAAYRAGEAWELNREEAVVAEEVSSGYEVDDPLVDWILESFEIDKQFNMPGIGNEWFTPTSTILSVLKSNNKLKDAGRREAMQIGGILMKLGCERGMRRMGDGSQKKGHFGIRIRQVTL